MACGPAVQQKRPALVLPDKPSIAVLAFRDHSGDPERAIEQSFAMMKSFTGGVAVGRPPLTIDSLLVCHSACNIDPLGRGIGV
jgi:hypothetical protein